ncbi:hypothetical protein D3C73_1557010 [compost metagenome]
MALEERYSRPCHDGDIAPTLMEQTASKTKVKFFVLDGGHDQLRNYETAHNLKVQAIIPLILRNEKEPTVGINSN